VKLYCLPSGETCHDSARLGAVTLPGMALAIASCIAYMTMNGVMIPSVSAGSNHVGASEM
jgi:bacteriorhodopsin